MEKIAVEALLRAGVHLGHRSSQWHPSMARFISLRKDKVHYINVSRTLVMMKRALRYIGLAVLEKRPILFVCTQSRFFSVISDGLVGTGVSFISKRWLGGLLTNFGAMGRQELETRNFCTPSSQVSGIGGEARTSQSGGYGLEGLDQMPGVLFIVGVERHQLAIREARKVGIPVVAIVDTNNPTGGINVPVPGNDDSEGSVGWYVSVVGSYVRNLRAKSNLEAGGS